jgi:hypothetical protein
MSKEVNPKTPTSPLSQKTPLAPTKPKPNPPDPTPSNNQLAEELDDWKSAFKTLFPQETIIGPARLVQLVSALQSTINDWNAIGPEILEEEVAVTPANVLEVHKELDKENDKEIDRRKAAEQRVADLKSSALDLTRHYDAYRHASTEAFGLPKGKCYDPATWKQETLHLIDSANLLHEYQKEGGIAFNLPEGQAPTPRQWRDKIQEYQYQETVHSLDVNNWTVELDQWKRIASIFPNVNNPDEVIVAIHNLQSPFRTKMAQSSSQSPPQPTGSDRMSFILTTKDKVVKSIWDSFNPDFQQGKKEPQNVNELNDLLTQHYSCQHPPQLATTLGADATQDWDTSIAQVVDLIDNPRIVAAPQGGAKLFKVTDVPRFEDVKEYEAYRQSLERFFKSQPEPSPREYATALHRIVSTFRDPAAVRAAAAWPIEDCLRGTWAETWFEFLAALDGKFGSATLVDDARQEFYKVRIQPGEDYQHFFNRLEAAVAMLKSAQRRHLEPAVAETVVTARLIGMMPHYLTNYLRLTQTGPLEAKEYKDLRQLYMRAHAFVPKPSTQSTSTTNQARSRAAPGQQQNPPEAGNQSNQVTRRGCGNVVSYDSQPPVPQHLRGSIFVSQKQTEAENQAAATRRQACITACVCLNCRRPASQHQTVGAVLKPIPPLNNPSTRAAPALLPTNYAPPAPVVPENRRIEMSGGSGSTESQ